MPMPPPVRKAVLVLHVVASVGWLGAVAAFFALSMAGLTSDDAETVRAVYIAMEPIGRSVIVPLSIVSLITGLMQSLGTPWGLMRHYWIVIKFGINVVATSVLLLYLPTLDSLADAAVAHSGTDLDGLRSASPALHSGIGLVLLVIATMLSLYKPKGLTKYGRRRRARQVVAV